MTMETYKRISTFVSVITILFVPLVTCYPKGAPTSACSTGLPQHGSFEPQKTPPPYQINVHTSEFKAGDTLFVTINSTQGVAFRGLFMQVRPLPGDSLDEFRDKPLGRFIRLDDENTKPLTCDITLETQTHSDRFAKYNLTLKWKSPLMIRNDVVVRATLLANFSTFWTNVESPRIKIIREGSLPVEALEKPWLKEVMKTVTAEGDKNATRELIKARFEKGFQNVMDPHGYIMVHYVTDILPFEDSFLGQSNVRDGFLATTPGTMASNVPTSGSSVSNATISSPLLSTDVSRRVRYETLVKSLLNGDKSVMDELGIFVGDNASKKKRKKKHRKTKKKNRH